jgi:hypothetical protein
MTWGTVGAILPTSPTARSPMLVWFLLCMAAVILGRFVVTGIYQIHGVCAGSTHPAGSGCRWPPPLSPWRWRS